MLTTTMTTTKMMEGTKVMTAMKVMSKSLMRNHKATDALLIDKLEDEEADNIKINLMEEEAHEGKATLEKACLSTTIP